MSTHSHSLSIRPAAPDEASSISGIATRSKAYWGYSANFMENARSELTLTPEFIQVNPTFVIEVDNRVMGFYSLKDLGGGIVDLYYLFIVPEAIGYGYGKHLWVHACQLAKAHSFHEIVVEADPNAEGFYANMGMVRYGEHESAVEKGRMLPLLRIVF